MVIVCFALESRHVQCNGSCLANSGHRERHPRQQKTPERFSISPEGFLATYRIDQAACLRFLRQPSRPNAPRPVANSGSAAGSGVAAANSMFAEEKKLVVSAPRVSVGTVPAGSLPVAVHVEMT